MTASITIDGGGSRGRARLRSDGMTATVSGPPLSLTTVDVDTVVARVLALIEELPQIHEKVAAISVGLAGGMHGGRVDAVRAAVRAKFPTAVTSVARDIDLIACQLAGPGAAAVVGTGVVVIVPTSAGEILVDGRGFAIGDRGGGAWIGVEALRRGLRDLDRRGDESPLLSALRARLGLESDRGVAAALSQDGRVDQRRVAALAPTVLELAERGNDDAAAVISGAVDAVSESVGWALERAAIGSGSEVVVAGGITGSSYFWELLRASLTAAGRVDVMRRVDPLDGTLA